MVTTRSKSSSALKHDTIPIDSYAWIRHARNYLKNREGSRSYFKCKHSTCRAKKVELCDQFNNVIDVVYKGQHKHDPPNNVTLKGCKVLTTAKSLKSKSIPTHGLERHPIEVVHNDDSTTVIATPTVNSDVAETDHKVTPRSKSLPVLKHVKIPTDGYAWIKYGWTKVKSPEGCSRRYFQCKHSACYVKKVKLCDQYNNVIEVIHKGQHTHDPPTPNIVISKAGKVLSTANGDSTTVMPATPMANADVAKADQKVATHSKSLSASKRFRIQTDSYAWKKYGRRHLKSSEGSQGYFKCKYSACQAKKLEFRDQFNSIIEVVYKGEHKHGPPKTMISKGGKVLSTAKSVKGKSISSNGFKDHLIDVGHIDGSEINQRSKTNSSESSVLKHPKKPKFIVHVAAGTKVSADSYKWRKYREKMVKGNPHPRNCYKCAFAGCTVKKHMEKVVDGSQVIVTYKGLHNHDITASSQSKKRGYSSTT